MRQASVANLRALQRQLLEVCERLERCQAGVADLRARKLQDTEVDQALQVDVLEPRGGLNHAAFCGGDLHRLLIGPLLDRAAGSLGQYLPVTDVAQVEMATAAGGLTDPEGLARHMKTALEEAAPLTCGSGRPSKAVERVTARGTSRS